MKRDIKYIIKRVIIGVLIAFIFASINKCNAYAETINVKLQFNNPILSFPQSTSGLYSLFELDSPYSSNKYNYYNNFNVSENNKYYAIFYDSTKDIYLYLIFNNFVNTANVDMSKVNILSYSSTAPSYETFVYQFYNTSTNQFQTMGGYTYGFILSNNVMSDFTDIFTYNTPIQHNSPILGEYFYENGSQPYLSQNIFDNFSLYDTNLSELYIDNVSIDFLPSNFESIELNDYQAVYFVPKNYNNIPTINVPDNCTIGTDDPCVEAYKFDYYYSGDIKQGYFALENTDILIQDYLYTSTSDDYSFESSFYSKEEEINGITYNYFAFLIANANYLYTSTIWYDSSLYDYYIINDMRNYQKNVCFIGKENTEVCLDIVFTKTLEDYWKEGFSTGGSEFTQSNQDLEGFLGVIFGIIKAPLDFLKRVEKSTCTSLSLPIPFINTNIELPCLSGLFKRVLGTNFYSIVQMLLNGLVIYRVTLLNIFCISDILWFKTDKLEVVEL